MKTIEQRIEAIKGNYHFVSPYHKKKKMLPFNILHRNFSDEFPVTCETVEYKGMRSNRIISNYKLEFLEEKINSGFLVKS